MYDHVRKHKDKLAEIKKDSTQPNIGEYSMHNIAPQKHDFEIAKFIASNNLSFSIVDPLVKLIKILSEESLYKQCHVSKINRTRVRLIINEGLSNKIKQEIEKKMGEHFCIL